MELAHGDKRLYLIRAVAYSLSGESDKAFKDVDKALSLDHNYEEAKELKQGLETEKKLNGNFFTRNVMKWFRKQDVKIEYFL
jgi:Tfp pilus assembly protein PilF